MSRHRRTADSVSNEEQGNNPSGIGGLTPAAFDPAEALQNLHGEAIQLEAMTHAASEAVTQLPFPSDREERRVFERAYALVSKAAEESAALVRYGDELVAALGVHLKKGRAAEDAAGKRS